MLYKQAFARVRQRLGAPFLSIMEGSGALPPPAPIHLITTSGGYLMNNRLCALLLALLLAALCLPCAADEAFTVTDMMGREVTLDAPASRVVALAASDCEILYAIGAGDAVVGRGEYCNYPAQAESVPVVSSGSATNIEQIIALAPQVVVMSIMAQTKEQVAMLESAGIKVIACNAQTIADVYDEIALLGQVTGKTDEAAALAQQMRAAFDDIAAHQPAQSGQTVYFEVSPLQWGLWTVGSGTFMDELATLCGLQNAFSDMTSWAAVSQEQVIERNPDYIITVAMYDGTGLLPADEIMAREGWENVGAVKNRNVLCVDNDEFSRPGPRLVNAARTLQAFVAGK